MATWSNLYMQNSYSPMMEQLIFFHENNMFILNLITIFILMNLMMFMKNKYINLHILENQTIETIWTIIPMLFLLLIAFPSLNILYLMDETNNPSITLKIMGNQWYWSYEYSDFKNISFDSYMIKSNSMNQFRLLEVDNRLILPFNTQIKCLISSNDVIHAWTVPALGVKIDAMPNRLNQIMFFMYKSGMIFGQCSEICGINHSFMPICLESIDKNSFISWMKKY
uniref:cytochrome c oxidase subunit II n=1 Tax=Neucentropus mandjuricus TaxID=1223783 RepID=UPI002113E836|nr:cytochrome c oxidase subunit II [Neucentropus mandjuricus]USL48463.1 cytochrome c oxidase subunit II [Neucentropus mandjuricus]